MSLYGALFAGVSGLSAQSNAMGMISDNIANVNTVGYKKLEARFSSMVTQETTLTTHSPGGVRAAPHSRIDQQGLLQGTTSETDLAVAGDGFFVVHEQDSPVPGSSYLFTRAGSFNTDDEGNLVNAAGYYLQGYDLLTNPTPPPSARTFSNLETVNLSNLSGSANATASIELSVNLPSTAAVSDSFTVTTQVFDSLGNAHDFDIDFVKTGTNAWSFNANDPVSGGAASGTGAGAGTLTFATDGTPAAITTTTPFGVTGWSTGAADSTFALDLGTVGSQDGLTQFANDFTISEIAQDGLQFGIFTGISINEEGIVTAIFDNGQRRDIYQLPLSTFNNPNGLEAVSGNAFLQTSASGDFQLNLSGNGGAGMFSPGSLENSTVDLAEEFTNMIITQRAYSASARTITTSDDMLEELIRIKR